MPAETGKLYAFWLDFFRNAGILPSFDTKYALVFEDNRIKPDMLLDLTKEYLRDMEITAVGDIIAILRHANIAHEKTRTLASRNSNEETNKETTPTTVASPTSVLSSPASSKPEPAKSLEKVTATTATEKLTPEDVIGKLCDVTNKCNGSAFALVPCSYVRIGTYVVFSTESLCIRVTIGEVGLYLQLPAYQTGETKEIGIPTQQILTMYSYSKRNKLFVKIQTGPKLARWIRGALKMDEDQNGLCYFCPMHQDEARHQFLLMFSEIDAYKLGVLQRLYKDKLMTLRERIPQGKCDTDSETEGNLVRVAWKGENCVLRGSNH